MKLYLALLESSHPEQTRIFAEIDGKLIDLNLAYAALLTQSANDCASAYELASYYFPRTLAAYLERGEPVRKALDEVAQFAHRAASATCAVRPARRSLTMPMKFACCRRCKIPRKVSSLAFRTERESKPCRKRKSPPAFTSCRKLSSLTALR